MAMGVAHALLQREHPKAAEQFLKLTHGGQSDVAQAIHFIGGDRLYPQEAAPLEDPRSNAHLQKVHEYINDTLLPGLRPFAHVPIEP